LLAYGWRQVIHGSQHSLLTDHEPGCASQQFGVKNGSRATLQKYFQFVLSSTTKFKRQYTLKHYRSSATSVALLTIVQFIYGVVQISSDDWKSLNNNGLSSPYVVILP